MLLKQYDLYRGVEQLAARWAHNPKVGGSSPPPATNRVNPEFIRVHIFFARNFLTKKGF